METGNLSYFVISRYIDKRCINWFDLWLKIPGGVTAAEGFNAAGMYGGLRAVGQKPDLALVTCDVNAVAAGSFQLTCFDLIRLWYGLMFWLMTDFFQERLLKM